MMTELRTEQQFQLSERSQTGKLQQPKAELSSMSLIQMKIHQTGSEQPVLVLELDFRRLGMKLTSLHCQR